MDLMVDDLILTLEYFRSDESRTMNRHTLVIPCLFCVVSEEVNQHSPPHPGRGQYTVPYESRIQSAFEHREHLEA